jgi:hypothetical protein
LKVHGFDGKDQVIDMLEFEIRMSTKDAFIPNADVRVGNRAVEGARKRPG